jgi:hypothetical protein
MTAPFTLTDQHLQLLARMYPRDDLSETEAGAPEFDGKRPYGNSDHLADIVEILHGPEAVTGPDGYISHDAISAEHLAEAKRLHAETATAFAVVWSVLTTSDFGGIEPGTYHSPRYGHWQRT